MRSQLHRIIPMILLVAACGGEDGSGGGGPPEVVTLIKWTPSGDNQTDTSGQTLPNVLRVKVTVDGANSPGHTVTFAGPGTFGTPTVVTGANGVATTTWTLPTEAGVTQATATLAGAVGSPLTFSATGTAGTAVQILKVSGDNQSTSAGEIFNGAFTLQVVDQYGNGKSGVKVYWGVTGPATVLTDSSPTDVDGYGRGYLTAQDSLGPVELTATVPGLVGSPMIFSGTVVGAASTIQVVNNAFQPATISITAGRSVRWVFVGSGHTVTSTGGGVIPNSPVLNAGAIWGPVLFATPGIYTYECSEHAGMTGSITVTP